jgi:hypothetical protein
MMATMARWAGLAPWLVAVIGLAVPLIAGGGAGWPYVVGWLVFLALLLMVKPLSRADQRDRIQWAVIATFLLVIPGLVVGGIYLVPAALLWLGIELGSRRRLSDVN